MSKESKLTLKFAILTIAFVATSNTIASVLLADIAKAFPEASMTAIQMVMTFGMIGAFPITFLAGFLATRIRKKPMILLGIFMIFAGGLLPILIRGSLMILYISAIIIGAGQGFLLPLISTIILESFSGEEQNSMLGLNSAVQNGGAMVLLLLAGFVAKTGWINVYFLYFFSIPAFIIVFLFLPKGEVPRLETDTGTKVKISIPWEIYVTCVLGFFFFVGYVTFAISISLFLDATGLGDATSTSLAMTLNTGFGVIAGLIFGKLVERLKFYIISFSALCAVLGFVLIYFAPNIILVYAGAAFLGLTFGLSGAGGGYVISRITTSPEQIGPSFSLLMTFTTAGVIASPFIVNSVTQMWAGTNVLPQDVFLTGMAIELVMTIAYFMWATYLTKSFPEHKTQIGALSNET